MTPEQRKTEFNRLYEALPGKNTDRIKLVCEALFCKPNTVRVWRMKQPTRVIPESKLKVLQRHFSTR
jgi:hypothetical protein